MRAKKPLSLLLTFALMLSLFPTTVFAEGSAYDDTSGHWAESAIAKWSQRDVLTGYNGHFRPGDPITRAEMAALLDRVIKYQDVGEARFTDVASSTWYYDNVRRLAAAGIVAGVGNNQFDPDRSITREEAAVMIGRAFHVAENSGNKNPFADAADISGWASFLVDGMRAAGYINGKPNGSFDPKEPITRAEVVTILNNMVDCFYHEAGETDNTDISYSPKNVVINTSGVSLKNTAITGDLYITPGVGSGEVTLTNVTVSGTTYIWGGGPGSVIAKDCDFNIIRINAATNPSLKLSESTKVGEIHVNDSTSVSQGGVTVKYDAATGTTTLWGATDKAVINADGTVTLTIGTLVYDIIPPEGKNLPPVTPPNDRGSRSKTTYYALSVGNVTGQSSINGTAVITVNNSTSGNFANGASVTVQANAASGFQFAGWYSVADGSGVPISDQNPYTFQITGATSLYVKFEVLGSQNAPFLIHNEDELSYMGRGSGNPADYGDWTLDKYYKLMDDIAITATNWTPIGSSTDPFTGGLDGNDKTISNLTISGNETDVGLFGYTDGAAISSVTMSGAKMEGSSYVGSLVGRMASGSITNCSVVDSEVKCVSYAGGLIGSLSITSADTAGVLDGCSATDNTIESSLTGPYVHCYLGGLAGMVYISAAGTNSTIIVRDCMSSGTIDFTGSRSVGAIIGYGVTLGGNLDIQNCQNNADLNLVNRISDVGGIVGYASNCMITDCDNTGDILKRGANIGGIAGNAQTGVTITDCSNSGTLSNTGNDFDLLDGSMWVAGIAGSFGGGTISGCTNTGDVNAYQSAAGIVGYLALRANAVVENCDNSGTVSAYHGQSGGISCRVDRYADGDTTTVRNATIQNCSNSGRVEYSLSSTERSQILATSYQTAITTVTLGINPESGSIVQIP